MGLESTTVVTGEPALSFTYDSKRSLYEQFAGQMASGLKRKGSKDSNDGDNDSEPRARAFGLGLGAPGVDTGDDSGAEGDAQSSFSKVELMGAPTYKQRRKKATTAGPQGGARPGMPGGPMVGSYGEQGQEYDDLVQISIRLTHRYHTGYEEERGRYPHRVPHSGRFALSSADSSLSLDRTSVHSVGSGYDYDSQYDSHDEAGSYGGADIYMKHGEVPHQGQGIQRKRHTLMDPTSMDATSSAWYGRQGSDSQPGYYPGDAHARGRSVDAGGRAVYNYDQGENASFCVSPHFELF